MKVHSIIYIIGIVQGLFLVPQLLLVKTDRRANKLLALILFVLSIDLSRKVIVIFGFTEYFVWFLGPIYSLPTLYGPLFYLYLQSLLYDTKFTRKVWLHFIGFFIHLLHHIPVFVMSDERKLHIYSHHMNWPNWQLSNFIHDLYGLGYAILTFLILLKHTKNVKREYSYQENKLWPWILSIFLIGIWSMSIFANFYNTIALIQIQFSIVVLFIFLIGHMTVYRPQNVNYSTIVHLEGPIEKKQFGNGSLKYHKTSLSPEKYKEIKSMLESSMANDKLYLNANLNIEELANNLKIPKHHISQVINTEFNKNFFEFINNHRIEESKVRLLSPMYNHLNIIDIAQDSGFNSKSSFNLNFSPIA
ncbi:MAG: helix-turn-helix domain-containing protein [Bacteriovoracaceae bacterium]|nr:helix-turn-helix domain-containing protein [Bacteriovoracaceae bacterium]